MRAIRAYRLVLVVGLVGGLASLVHALPPQTVTLLYKSGETVTSVGQINHPLNGGAYGGNGILGFAINNSGSAYVQVSVNAAPPFVTGAGATNQAVLFSGTGLSPYLGGGVEWDNSNPAGSITLPTTDYTYVRSFCTALNNSGTGIFDVLVGANSFSSVPPVTGMFFNKSAIPVREGDAVTAAGVIPGTVIGTLQPWVQINDNNVVLVACTIVESGQTKNAILKVALNGVGGVLSETLVAKEGGPVGAGPATWTTLSIAKNASAINNAGDVIFSGLASSGASGLYRTSGVGGAFVATTGGATPNGSTWNSLLGVPVDLSNTGHFVFRGVPGGNSLWNELGDAGELFGSPAGFFTPTTNVTQGGGPLNLISGSLSNDVDVDIYQILIGDASLGSQTPFSATTVPDAGSGFAGANFDTVLYLFSFNTFNNNGSSRHGVGRCDNAAPGVMQSTLTTASLPPTHAPGQTYFLAIATPKARPTRGGNFTNNATDTQPYPNMWQVDPGYVAVAGGIAYWVDPSTGRIERVDTATGAALSSLQVGTVPQQFSGVQAANASSRFLDAKVAVYDAGANSRIIFQQHGQGQDTFKSCNVDGTGIVNIVTTPGSSGASAIAVDSVNAKLYWSRIIAGGAAEIYRSDLDGSNSQTVITITDPLNSGESYNIESIAIDTAAPGKVYWSQSVFTIPTSSTYLPGYFVRRCNLDGTGVQNVVNNARASSITIDAAGRRLYYTSNGLNKVSVLNLTTLANTQLVSTAAPLGVSVDVAAAKVYWTSPFERMIRRSSTAAGSVENWYTLAEDVGEYPAEGSGYDNAYNSFVRSGTAGSTALPYQIKLTGASFANTTSMICKDNTTKVVLAGESISGTGNRPVNAAGTLTSPVRISDRGLVAWYGTWNTSGGSERRGLFLNTDKLLDDTTVPINGSLQLGTVDSGASGFDMCASGQFLIANTTYLPFSGGAGSSAVTISFASVPGCAADFNGDGVLSVQDIFDFLGAWFAGTPSADFNGAGGISVQDIFDFLGAWFAGC